MKRPRPPRSGDLLSFIVYLITYSGWIRKTSEWVPT